MKTFYVYILASERNSRFYTGVTSNILRRSWEHKEAAVDGYSARHNIKKLVYVEEHQTAEFAIRREKLIKKWRRQWKKNLVEKHNPEWRDLYQDLNK